MGGRARSQQPRGPHPPGFAAPSLPHPRWWRQVARRLTASCGGRGVSSRNLESRYCTVLYGAVRCQSSTAPPLSSSAPSPPSPLPPSSATRFLHVLRATAAGAPLAAALAWPTLIPTTSQSLIGMLLTDGSSTPPHPPPAASSIIDAATPTRMRASYVKDLCPPPAWRSPIYIPHAHLASHIPITFSSPIYQEATTAKQLTTTATPPPRTLHDEFI